MYEILKKIHMYTGLLTFSALIVFGVAGVHATLRAPEQHRRSETMRLCALPSNTVAPKPRSST